MAAKKVLLLGNPSLYEINKSIRMEQETGTKAKEC